MELHNINDFSMNKVIFYINGETQDSLFEKLDYSNLVFANDGIYQVIKNDLFLIIKKTQTQYSNTALAELEDNQIIQFIPKPAQEYLDKIVDLFRYVNDKSKNELMINLYYDKENNDFIIDIVDQVISGALVTYKYDQTYEMDQRYVRYLQVHSHNVMSANFSSIDNKDETNKILSYFGVIGKLQKYNNTFESKFRIWSGVDFLEVNIDEVFNTEICLANISTDEKAILDNIIKN